MPAAKTDKQARVKDPVSEMRIFKESVKKEQASEKINQDFYLNQPNRLHFNTQKPNNNPYLLMKLQQQGATLNGVNLEQRLQDGFNRTQLSQQVTDKLKTVTHTPKDKWSEPQTANQEIGWWVDKQGKDNPQFTHKREGCNETHYADSYYTMKHCSLFSNKSQK